jgi:hypothetical protein
MKIRFAIVSVTFSHKSELKVDALLHAVNVGDMDGVDASTAQLLELTVDCRSIELSEEEWRVFLSEIRAKNPDFKSSYLLPGYICARLFPKHCSWRLCSRTSN